MPTNTQVSYYCTTERAVSCSLGREVACHLCGKLIKLIRNPLLQKAAALCCVEDNKQKCTHLWKQTSKGIPPASKIILLFFFPREFLSFMRMQKPPFWARLKVYLVHDPVSDTVWLGGCFPLSSWSEPCFCNLLSMLLFLRLFFTVWCDP